MSRNAESSLRAYYLYKHLRLRRLSVPAPWKDKDRCGREPQPTAFQRGDFVLPEKSEVFQVRNHVPIIRLNPELVKAINAGSFWIEPDRPRLSFAEFCAIGLRDEWHREPKDGPPELFSAKVH